MPLVNKMIFSRQLNNVCGYVITGHIYFRGPPVVIRLFFVRCVYYTLIRCV